jgi:tripartite-type tricarboxylate transporter receptor subunit TctC
MPPSEQAAKGDKAMKRRSEVILTAKGPVVTGREGSRAVAKLALAALLAACGAAPALAQDYPNKPIRLISAHAAGGGADQVSRTISDPLSRLLRQPVIVENRAGASTMIAAEYVAQAVPDGYTILMATVTTLSINPSLYQKIRYDPIKDFVPVTNVASTPFFLGVHPALPVKTVGELIELEKQKPGVLNYGSSGNGTSSHLAGELFNDLAGVRIVHGPYKATATRAADLISGVIQVAFANDLLPFAQAGRVRILGVTSSARLSGYPDIPTVAEAARLPSYEASVWYGMVAPAGTPAPIVNRLYEATKTVLAEAEIKQKIMKMLGGEVVGNSPAEFAAQIKSDLAKWARVIQRSKVTVDQ